jgi:hypothetical protein
MRGVASKSIGADPINLRPNARTPEGSAARGAIRAGVAQPPARSPEPSTTSADGPDPIAAFIDLEAEARGARDLAELRFIIVNSTRRLARFDQAFLLEPSRRRERWRISAASSVATVDRDSEVAQVIETWANDPTRLKRHPLDKVFVEDLLAEGRKVVLEKAGFESHHALWTPIKGADDVTVAGLLSLRQKNWEPGYATLMSALCEAYGHSWRALNPVKQSVARRYWEGVKHSHLGLLLVGVIVGGAFIPMPLSVLAPAEVVGATPTLITAPIDGVVKEVLIPPGVHVDAGEALVTLIDTKLRNDVEIAGKAKSVAEAKYFKVLQSAVSTQKDMQDLSIAKSELSIAEAELANARDLLARSIVKAPRAGVLVYSAKSDLVGKPVALGERMMEIADPESLELRIDVPVSDAIALEAGGSVKLFLDGEPLQAIDATIDRIGYRAVATQDRQLAFRAFAHFEDDRQLRLGLRGTARLQGKSVRLGFYLLRRPIAFLRQKVGL